MSVEHIVRCTNCARKRPKTLKTSTQLKIGTSVYGNACPNCGTNSFTVIAYPDQEVPKEEKQEISFIRWLREQDTTETLLNRICNAYKVRHNYYQGWNIMEYTQEVFPNIWKRYNQI